MKRNKDGDKGMATLAVLAAAAREAEELLNCGEEIEADTTAEANRRMRLFMETARHMAR